MDLEQVRTLNLLNLFIEHFARRIKTIGFVNPGKHEDVDNHKGNSTSNCQLETAETKLNLVEIRQE